jgi:hypothetical protein
MVTSGTITIASAVLSGDGFAITQTAAAVARMYLRRLR